MLFKVTVFVVAVLPKKTKRCKYYPNFNAGGWLNEHKFAKFCHRECINDKTIQDFIIK